MNYFNTDLSRKQYEILFLIYKYRSLTNEHLRRLLSGHLSSSMEGQKANISRETANLKKKKYIESFSCHPYSKELIHCLTKKGVELINEFTLTDADDPYAGFEGQHLGSFNAATLKKWISNIEHTMMFLDFAIKYKDSHDIRHNLYAVKNYSYYLEDEKTMQFIYKNAKVRPDGECLWNDKLFTIEIDTGTERYWKLVEKFRHYKSYFDYCIEQNIPEPWEGMIFVCKPTHLEVKRDKRLHNILKAACEGLEYYAWTFPLKIIDRQEGHTLVLNYILNNYSEFLDNLGIDVPSKVNIVLEEKKRKEKQKIVEEEERKRKSEEAQRRVAEEIQRQRMEYELRRKEFEENLLRDLEKEEKKKKGVFGKFFS